MAPPASRFVEVNGLRLHHLDWGNDGAMPLVFVHGLSGNAHNFDGAAERLRDRFHVIAVDVRGRGDSAWSPDGAYQYANYVSDLEGIVDTLGLQRLVLAGTSMGGRISMIYAMRHPERLAGVVFNDIGPDSEAGSERIRQNQGNVPASFANVEEIIAFRSKTSPVFMNLDRDTQVLRVGYEVRRSDDGRFVWKHDATWQAQRFERGSEDLSFLWPAFEKMEVPALLLWGTVSDVLSNAQAQRIVAALPDSTLVPVEGVGHAPTLNEPDAAEGLDRFLTGVLTRDRAGSTA